MLHRSSDPRSDQTEGAVIRKTQSKVVEVKFIARNVASGKRVERVIKVAATDAMLASPSLVVDVARKALGKLVERCDSIIWKTGLSLGMSREAYHNAMNAGAEEE